MNSEDTALAKSGDLPAALFQDYCPLRPWCFVAKFRYQPQILQQFRESRSLRFFRPLLYQLSYLGESLILLEIRGAGAARNGPMV